MIFVGVPIDETIDGINYKLELRREGLEYNGFKVSTTKTKHKECNFSKRRQRSKDLVTITRKEVAQRYTFII